MSAVWFALVALCAEQASAGWTAQEGACRKDAEGTAAGVENTDYQKYAKKKFVATDLAHCKTLCEGWEEEKGQKCYGVEATTPSFGYCEIWVTKPEGKSDSSGHICNTYDGSTWTDQVGACRIDAAGADAGVANTDFTKFDKAKEGEVQTHVVESVPKCKEMCETWGETIDGATCYGIEVLSVGEDDFDYCEFWLTKPEGTAESAKHGCHVYEPDIQAKGKAAPEVDVSSTSTCKALTAVVSTALAYGLF